MRYFKDLDTARAHLVEALRKFHLLRAEEPGEEANFEE